MVVVVVVTVVVEAVMVKRDDIKVKREMLKLSLVVKRKKWRGYEWKRVR